MDSLPPLRIVIAGHVDHGKSTLIGRLFYDTGSLPVERYREIESSCAALGRPFEFSFLVDALEEERQHGITIDTAQTYFRSARRRYVIIDAPGHKEFLKNMITGAAAAEAAILLVDAVEGVRDQTKRHAYVLSLLGLDQVLVAVNKLDQLGFGQESFTTVTNELCSFLKSLRITPRWVIPISAKYGDNVARTSERTPWYEGPTLLKALDQLESTGRPVDLPLRFPVQDIYVWDGKRIYAGRIETGRLQPGMPVIFSPSGKGSIVKSIEKWGQLQVREAGAGDSIGITLEEPLFIERGEIMAPVDEPVPSATEIHASIFWLGKSPLRVNETYGLKLGTAEVNVEVKAILERVDSSTLEILEQDAQQVQSFEVAGVVLAASQPVPAEVHQLNAWLGRFVIVDGGWVSGGGIVKELKPPQSHADFPLPISLFS